MMCEEIIRAKVQIASILDGLEKNKFLEKCCFTFPLKPTANNPCTAEKVIAPTPDSTARKAKNVVECACVTPVFSSITDRSAWLPPGVTVDATPPISYDFP